MFYVCLASVKLLKTRVMFYLFFPLNFRTEDPSRISLDTVAFDICYEHESHVLRHVGFPREQPGLFDTGGGPVAKNISKN